MRTSDLLATCMRNLLRRKFRTFLTVTGVVIGTTSIIMMISLALGISRQQEEQLKQWRDLSIIDVRFGGAADSEIVLNDEAITKMLAIDGVDVATPFLSLQIQGETSIYAGKTLQYRMRWPSIIGVYPEALEKMGYKIDKGETLPTGKTTSIKAVFGSQTAYQFEDSRKKVNNWRNPWPDESGNVEEPFFESIGTDYKLTLAPSENGETNGKPLEYEFDVVGTLVGEQNKWDSISSIFMPIAEVQRLQAEYNKENDIKTDKNQSNGYEYVKVRAEDLKQIAEIETQIKEMGFATYSMETERQEALQRMLMIQIILGGVGGITLLVSAISITNTMIMSVYERTREIGVMKVLGCLVSNIRAIFLIEAGFIGFFGGVIGVGLSFALSFVLNAFGGAISGGGGLLGLLGGYGGATDRLSVIPAWLVLFGLAFATLIGLVAGFYPANRAVKISALEAIKQE